MDSLRYSIGLRAHGQRDPLIEYKAEAFKIFEELMLNIKSEICRNIFLSASSMSAFQMFLQNVPQRTLHQSSAATATADAPNQIAAAAAAAGGSEMVTEATAAIEKARTQPKPPPARLGPKVGRNDPCPCRSGKKYKQCCGK